MFVTRVFAKTLHWCFQRTLARGKPTQIITNGTEENLPYLRRWKIIDAKWWCPGIYLHNMILDDDASLHDQPYASVSIALTDGLKEYYVERPSDNHPASYENLLPRRVIRQGDVIYRSSSFAHCLKVAPGGAWTLFIPFRRLKKGWGFWCPRGWKRFDLYHRDRRLAMAAGKKGPLIGCGEE